MLPRPLVHANVEPKYTFLLAHFLPRTCSVFVSPDCTNSSSFPMQLHLHQVNTPCYQVASPSSQHGHPSAAGYVQLDGEKGYFPSKLVGHTCKHGHQHAEYGTAVTWDYALRPSVRHSEQKSHDLFTSQPMPLLNNHR